MNFIADSPEDVNGWVEGMELHVLRFSKTSSVAPVLLLVKFATYILGPLCLSAKSKVCTFRGPSLKEAEIYLHFFFLWQIRIYFQWFTESNV